MRYFRIPDPDGGPDRYRALSEAKGAPSAGDMGIDLTAAHPVPRMPNDFERWDVAQGRYVADAAGRADAEEDARLRCLSPRERHGEAIARALAEFEKRHGKITT